MIHCLTTEGVSFVTLNTLATRNALNDTTVDGLEAALDAASSDGFVRVSMLKQTVTDWLVLPWPSIGY